VILNKPKLCLIIFFITVSSCDIIDSSRHLTGRFYLKHNKFGKSINYQVDDNGSSVEIISGAFGRIGVDNNYIIVENSDYEYSIIRVKKEFDYFPDKGILGPFSSSEFKKQKQKLGITADFTINSN
jgi:hypothetical protein